MSVTAVTETLRTLHRIHRQLEDLADRLEAGPRQVAARSALLAKAEGERAAAQDALKQARLAADQKQLQLKSAEVKLGDLQSKLNGCKTNREYQALGEQISADRMAARVLEDEILEALERIDALKPGVPAAEAGVERARGLVAAAKAQVAAEAGELEAELARVRGELATVERELADDLRERYLRVVRSKGADGLAAIDGQACGGCFQRITGNMLAEIQIGRPVVCRNCGRLLYLPETARSA